MSNKIATVLITLSVLLGASTALAQGENPFIGSWDIDFSLSSFGNAPVPQNMSRSYTDLGNGNYAYQVATVAQDGTLSLSSAIYSYSGEQSPIISFDEQPEQSLISYRRINDTTVEYTIRVGGVVTQIGAKFISPNYQRLTISTQSPNTEQSDQILVFNRRR